MKLTETQNEAVHSTSGNVLVHAGAGSGKALANGTKVKTPRGSINIEGLSVGDEVFGVDGNIYKVQGVYPQGEKEVWEVEFSNGTIIECCEDHLWTWQTASRRSKGGKWDTNSIRYIYENVKLKMPSGKNFKNNVYLPITDPVKYSKKELPIDPYILGVILGDGGMSKESGVRFTNAEDDVVEKVELLLNNYGYTLSHMSKRNANGNYNIIQIDKNEATGSGNKSRLRKALEELNLFGSTSLEKFIPKVYMESDIDDRLNLLAGLIDTDGYRASSYYEYSTSSKELADDVAELCSSLGLTAKISTKENPTYEYKGQVLKGNTAHRIFIKESNRFPKLHTSKKHESRWSRGQSKSRITMKSITPTTELKNMTCISVSSPDSLFLIDGYIATHNTSCFTARVANLVGNKKVDPSSILGLTFTKDAAENMRVRLKGLIGKKRSDSVQLTTFHSFAYGILKQNYPSEYQGKQIAQQWWKMSKLYDIVSENSYSNNVGLNMSIKAGELGSFISYQKSNMVKLGMDVIIDDNVSYASHISEDTLQKAFDTYCELVRNARVIEFDDMLVDLYYKLKEDKDLLKDIKGKYKYVMVDEFQDTNTINLEIIRMISDNNLFVVGDFRQGIYGFINANINNILDFTTNFEDVHLIELQENFRSTDSIVSFANKVIEVSPVEKYKQFSEQLPARHVAGEAINISVYSDDYAEVTGIGNKIKGLIESGKESDYSDFAILSRTNTLLGFYESEFANMGIPVDLSSGKSFFDRKEISDLLAYAEHTLDKTDDMSIRKIINSPSRFISKALINQLDEYAYNNSISFERACSDMDCGKSNRNIGNLILLFDQLRDHEDISASRFLKEVYRKSGYEKHIEKTTATLQELSLKKDAIDKLFELSKKFPNIKSFLAHVSIIKSNNKKNKDGVKMMTVHGSKGLEFRHVFLPSITENNFPHEMSNDEEEERRLFYVATSRAKDFMDISIPVFTAGGSGATYNPSPFLLDVVGEDNLSNARKAVRRGDNEYSFSYQ